MTRALLLALAAMVLSHRPVVAQDSNSANWMMEGCRTFLTGKVDTGAFKAGVCAGTISGLAFMGSRGGFCLPDQVTGQQLVRVVVTFLDRKPERLHESFRSLAVEAFVEVWPCP